jgi:hypothetical protein
MPVTAWRRKPQDRSETIQVVPYRPGEPLDELRRLGETEGLGFTMTEAVLPPPPSGGHWQPRVPGDGKPYRPPWDGQVLLVRWLNIDDAGTQEEFRVNLDQFYEPA